MCMGQGYFSDTITPILPIDPPDEIEPGRLSPYEREVPLFHTVERVHTLPFLWSGVPITRYPIEFLHTPRRDVWNTGSYLDWMQR
jgi:hypothetical protein